MAHCGAEYIDRDLPGQIVDSLYKEFDCHPHDIVVYIGPHAQEFSYTYDSYPKSIKNENRWIGCLREEDELIHINLNRAILMQLTNRGINLDYVHSSNIDTITNHNYYSNNRAGFDRKKEGRFYTGCFFQESNEKVLCLIR